MVLKTILAKNALFTVLAVRIKTLAIHANIHLS